ncbi:MAG: hypothetical protein E6J41_23470 [Chloroflexi bacterium]|nr:MAG: hypothetical protein E6J41_23470 [Chloroflexota bacterium]
MSIDQYHFHMVLRQQEMSRADRLAADEQAGRIAQGLSEIITAIARIGRRPARRVAAAGKLRRISS